MTEKDKDDQKPEQKKSKDQLLWEREMSDVKPLRQNNIQVDSASSPKENQASETVSKARQSKKAAPSMVNEPQRSVKIVSSLDRRTEQKLKRGQMNIEGKLDLHGMTQIQAYDALQSFIPQMAARNKRCVLIITGKGTSKSGQESLQNFEPGILKQKTPQWLQEEPLRKYVLSVQTAQQRHGGHGALYVLLKRNRNQ